MPILTSDRIPWFPPHEQAERRHPMRVVLLLPLQFSSQAVKVAALQGRSRVIRCIEGWVNEAFTEANSPPPGRPPNPAVLQVLKAAIACMASLPMDVETMRRTGAGRVAGSLRKYNYDGKGPDSVQGRAVELVDQWKRLARDPILSATEEASASASNASKKAKVVGDKLKVDVSRAGGTAGAYPSPASAASPSNVGGGVQMKDGDEQLLKDLAAKPGTTGGGIRNSVPTVRKVCWVGGEVNSCEAHVVCCSFYCCAEVSVCSFLLFRCTHYSG